MGESVTHNDLLKMRAQIWLTAMAVVTEHSTRPQSSLDVCRFDMAEKAVADLRAFAAHHNPTALDDTGDGS